MSSLQEGSDAVPPAAVHERLVPLKIKLQSHSWYGWQVLTAEAGFQPPWNASPILVTALQPLKTGCGLLAIECVVALRPLQPRPVSATFQVLYHAGDLIVGRWREGEAVCTVAIVAAEWDWLRQCCAQLLEARDPAWGTGVGSLDTVGEYLDYHVGAGSTLSSRADHNTFYAQPIYRPRVTRGLSWHAVYEGVAAWLVLQGVRPQVPEQRWSIVPVRRDDGYVLEFARSWSGFLVWEWSFQIQDDALLFSDIRLGIDRERYAYATPEEEIQRLLTTFETDILGKPSPCSSHGPIDRPLAEIEDAWIDYERRAS